MHAIRVSNPTIICIHHPCMQCMRLSSSTYGQTSDRMTWPTARWSLAFHCHGRNKSSPGHVVTSGHDAAVRPKNQETVSNWAIQPCILLFQLLLLRLLLLLPPAAAHDAAAAAAAAAAVAPAAATVSSTMLLCCCFCSCCKPRSYCIVLSCCTPRCGQPGTWSNAVAQNVKMLQLLQMLLPLLPLLLLLPLPLQLRLAMLAWLVSLQCRPEKNVIQLQPPYWWLAILQSSLAATARTSASCSRASCSRASRHCCSCCFCPAANYCLWHRYRLLQQNDADCCWLLLTAADCCCCPLFCWLFWSHCS